MDKKQKKNISRPVRAGSNKQTPSSLGGLMDPLKNKDLSAWWAKRLKSGEILGITMEWTLGSFQSFVSLPNGEKINAGVYYTKQKAASKAEDLGKFKALVLKRTRTRKLAIPDGMEKCKSREDLEKLLSATEGGKLLGMTEKSYSNYLFRLKKEEKKENISSEKEEK